MDITGSQLPGVGDDLSDSDDLAGEHGHELNRLVGTVRLSNIPLRNWQRRPRLDHLARVIGKGNTANGSSVDLEERSGFLRLQTANGERHGANFQAEMGTSTVAWF